MFTFSLEPNEKVIFSVAITIDKAGIGSKLYEKQPFVVVEMYKKVYDIVVSMDSDKTSSAPQHFAHLRNLSSD